MLNPALPRHALFYIFFICCFSATLISCADSENAPILNEEQQQNSDITTKQITHTTPTTTQSSISALIQIIDEHFLKLTSASKQLNQDLIAFTKKPSEAGLKEVTEALEETHALFVSGYFLENCCRIYSPEITKKNDDLTALSLKTKLDQYPLLPGYLDTVEGYPYSGLIYSDIPITRQSMEREFQLGDPAYVTLGFHALDLIIKGSHSNRKVSDFSRLTITKDTRSAPAELRRTLYAILLSSEIENDIGILKLFWESDLKLQLAQTPSSQVHPFIKHLQEEAESTLNKGLAVESGTEIKGRLDEHQSKEIIKLEKVLLEKLISISEPQTEP